jgi:AcrR family transcriptional regulator
MSPRPRSISDLKLIETAIDVVGRLGVENTRLVDISEASGLAPATLVQRFGSRDGLLIAVGQALVRQVAAAFAVAESSELRRMHSALLKLPAVQHFVFFSSRSGLAALYSLELRKQIAFALAAAVESGELAHCDVADRARRIQMAYYGVVCASLLEGQPVVASHISALIDEILADYA